MTVPKYLISSFLLFFLAALLAPIEVKSQCSSSVSVKSTKNSSSESSNDGSIALLIESKGEFKCTLYSYVNATKVLHETKTGKGNSIIDFFGLSNKPFYKVDFIFFSENDPICQSRVIDPIDLTGKRK
jgi:hypothetical protein